jgi:tRNA (guanine37-N1)-methyltransferase
MGNEESHRQDSFSQPGTLDHPHFTRPRSFRGMEVPAVLLSGDHGRIEAWRRQAAREKAERNRPDLSA